MSQTKCKESPVKKTTLEDLFTALKLNADEMFVIRNEEMAEKLIREILKRNITASDIKELDIEYFIRRLSADDESDDLLDLIIELLNRIEEVLDEREKGLSSPDICIKQTESKEITTSELRKNDTGSILEEAIEIPLPDDEEESFEEFLRNSFEYLRPGEIAMQNSAFKISAPRQSSIDDFNGIRMIRSPKDRMASSGPRDKREMAQKRQCPLNTTFPDIRTLPVKRPHIESFINCEDQMIPNWLNPLTFPESNSRCSRSKPTQLSTTNIDSTNRRLLHGTKRPSTDEECPSNGSKHRILNADVNEQTTPKLALLPFVIDGEIVYL
ncbi:hypothetical protein ACOME3_001080 [Neoechinorhynchus agilis]